MNLYLIDTNFSGIDKAEKAVEIKHKSDKIMICVSESPVDKSILVSIYRNREPVIYNRNCLIGDYIVDYFAGEKNYDMKCDFVFIPDENFKGINGNKLKKEHLNGIVKLYLVTEE